MFQAMWDDALGDVLTRRKTSSLFRFGEFHRVDLAHCRSRGNDSKMLRIGTFT